VQAAYRSNIFGMAVVYLGNCPISPRFNKGWITSPKYIMKRTAPVFKVHCVQLEQAGNWSFETITRHSQPAILDILQKKLLYQRR